MGQRPGGTIIQDATDNRPSIERKGESVARSGLRTLATAPTPGGKRHQDWEKEPAHWPVLTGTIQSSPASMAGLPQVDDRTITPWCEIRSRSRAAVAQCAKPRSPLSHLRSTLSSRISRRAEARRTGGDGGDLVDRVITEESSLRPSTGYMEGTFAAAWKGTLWMSRLGTQGGGRASLSAAPLSTAHARWRAPLASGNVDVAL